jgi:hypothetical protein
MMSTPRRLRRGRSPPVVARRAAARLHQRATYREAGVVEMAKGRRRAPGLFHALGVDAGKT